MPNDIERLLRKTGLLGTTGERDVRTIWARFHGQAESVQGFFQCAM